MRWPLESAYRKKRQYISKDDFGIEDESGQRRWDQEVFRYIDKLILPNAALEDKKLCFDYANNATAEAVFLGFDGCFKEVLKFYFNATVDANAEQLAKSVDSARPDDGIAYEHFCCSKFKEFGRSSRVTQASLDQGCDLIATIGDITLVVQCKLYSKPVGNGVVQEVVGAMRHYGGTHGVVVTNSSFTQSAKVLARSNGIYLIHDSEINMILAQIRSSR